MISCLWVSSISSPSSLSSLIAFWVKKIIWTRCSFSKEKRVATVEKKESFIPFVFLHDSEVRKQKLCPMQPEIKGSRQETWCQKKRKRNGWSLGYKKKVSSWDEFQARKLSLKRLQNQRQDKREEYKSRCNCKKCILETKKTPEDSSLRGRCRETDTQLKGLITFIVRETSWRRYAIHVKEELYNFPLFFIK